MLFAMPSAVAPPITAAAAQLARIAGEFAPAALASSFGAEDMVLLDLIAKHAPSISVFTLDTGRLPPETLDLMDRVHERYPIEIEIYRPDQRAVAEYVRVHGLNGFYEGIEQRKSCCAIRKVEPLRRALTGKRAWLTGLRREQADERAQLQAQTFDADHGLAKFNPLIDWTTEDVWAYLRAFDVPYNALHDRGYPSIGCEPCTRAIKPGEPLRAGRWWWESGQSRECGLHVSITEVR
jgi:phosphoadenosine phosphosulfate reductase